MELSAEQLFRQYQKDVYCYLLSLTQNTAAAEDLTSETFLAAILSLHRFRGESSIKTWLFSIARNKWKKYLTQNHSEITDEVLLTLQLTNSFSMEELADRKDCIAQIQKILSELPPKQAQIFTERVWGFSYTEIAQRHGLFENSVRVMVFRTRQKILQKLKKEEYI